MRRYLLLVFAGIALALSASAQARDIYLVSQNPLVPNKVLRDKLPGFQSGVNDVESWWGTPQTVDHVVLKVGTPPWHAWRIYVQPNRQEMYYGYHDNTAAGTPRGIVLSTPDWPVTLTHELFEMMLDPGPGNVTLVGPTGKIYLVEIADPVETHFYWRRAVPGQKVRISDFVGPNWYDGVRSGFYDFMGLTVAPHQCLPGGYFSYLTYHGWDQTYC